MNYDKNVDLFDLKKLFIEDLDEAIKYEQYLHRTGKFRDFSTKHYDNDKERSIAHLTNMINGGMKQEMWFEEREKFLNIKPLQPLGIINPHLTSEQKNEPDFIKVDTNETVEFKWCDSDKYMEDYDTLYVKKECWVPAGPEDLHNADRVIIVKLENETLYEYEFIRKGEYYDFFRKFELKHHLLDMYNKYKL